MFVPLAQACKMELGDKVNHYMHMLTLEEEKEERKSINKMATVDDSPRLDMSSIANSMLPPLMDS